MRSRVLLLVLLVAGAGAGALLALSAGSEPKRVPKLEPRSAGSAVGDEVDRAAEALSSAAGEVRNVKELLAAVRRPSSAGKLFLMRAGDYGELDLRGVQPERLITLRAFPGERAEVGLTTMADTRNIRLEGLRFSGPIDIQPGINRRIELVGNDIGGYLGVGVNLRDRSSDILIEGNEFHDLTQSGGSYAAGYGVRVSSPTVEVFRLTIVGNTFTRLGNDAMELGGVNGLLVAGNEVSGVDIEAGSDAHADPLFLWAGSRNVVVRNNSFHDNSQPVYLRGGTRNVVFENNLVARSENYCMQVGGTGPPADQIEGLKMRNNTIWDCGFGGILFSFAGRGWRLENNIVQSLHSGPPFSSLDSFDVQAFNLVGEGAGPRDQAGKPLFTAPEEADYRLEARSPGIDAATSVGAPRSDNSGHPRSDDPGVPNRGGGSPPYYDVGAYERAPD